MTSMDWSSIISSKLNDSLRLKNIILNQISKNKERLTVDPLNACNSLKKLFMMLEIVNTEIEEKMKSKEKLKIRYFTCYKDIKRGKVDSVKTPIFYSKLKCIPKFLQDVSQKEIKVEVNINSSNCLSETNQTTNDIISNNDINENSFYQTKSNKSYDIRSSYSLKSINQMDLNIQDYNKDNFLFRDDYSSCETLISKKRKNSDFPEDIFVKNYFDYKSDDDKLDSNQNKIMKLKQNPLIDDPNCIQQISLSNELLLAQFNIPILEEINLD